MMLILVQKGEPHGGFFLKRKAKKGKLPPTVVGLRVGKYPCVLLKVYGDITPGNGYLVPYLERGDILIPHKGLEKLGFHISYVEEFTRRQCVNALKQHIKTAPKTFETVLWDGDGYCVGVAAELCSLKRPLWVVTNRAETYGPCSEYALLTFGNPPVMGSKVPPNAKVILAPYGIPREKVPVGLPTIAPGYIWAKKEELTLPVSLADTVPLGFDPVWVAAGCMAAFGAGMEESACLPLEGKVARQSRDG